MERIINFALREKINTAPLPYAFSFTPENGWVSLQRLAFWFLRKIGAHARQTIVTAERTSIRINDVERMVSRAIHESWIRGERVDQILLGEDQYLKLGAFPSPMTYTQEGPSIQGIRVRFAPWIDGVVVVPK